MVSPCCGAEYSDHIDDEENDVYICRECEETFTEPIEDYEYHQQMLDAKAEARDDERRDMGL
tara:strand:- start:242 stop:427 length:186 start_codon:yes stop_codon:yes gene_type:complete